MKHRRVVFGSILVLLLALIPLVSVQAGRSRTLYLDWREVVPEGTGDPNMFGEATLDVNAGRARLCYTMRVGIFAALEVPTGATIHRAPAGFNGPEVLDLNVDFGPLGETTESGCVGIDKTLAHDIQKNPTQYYLLVTDEDYPDGAARVQLTK